MTCAIGVACSVAWLRDLSRREQAHAELARQLAWFKEQEARRRAAFAELERQLAAADPGRLLSPARLASADGRAQLHEALGTFRALLGRRRASIRLSFETQARLLDGLPAGERRERLRESAERERRRFDAAFEDLDGAQEAACDAISTLVGWADAHAGELVLEGGRAYLRPGADNAAWQDRNDAVARALASAKAAAGRMEALETRPAASAPSGVASR